jgi:hypothetical protein
MAMDELLSANITADPGLVSALGISRMYLIAVFVLLAIHLFVRSTAAPRPAANRGRVNHPAPEDTEDRLVP